MNVYVYISEAFIKSSQVIHWVLDDFHSRIEISTTKQKIGYVAVTHFLTLKPGTRTVIHDRLLKLFSNDCSSYYGIIKCAAEESCGRNDFEKSEIHGNP